MIISLDTNAYSALKRGHVGVADRVRQSERVLISAVVVGELMFGFHHGHRYEKNVKEFEEFLSSPFVQLSEVSLTTADRFGRIASILRSNGTPIPTNDIWIAAHTFETGAELLSFDQHFSKVEGLVWSLMVG